MRQISGALIARRNSISVGYQSSKYSKWSLSRDKVPAKRFGHRA